MKFKANPNFEADLRRDPAYRQGLLASARTAKRAVEAASPRGSTGDYAGSIRVEEHGGEVLLGSIDPAGHIVEWGSVNNPPYAPLRRGVRAAGLRLVEQSK